MSKYVAIASNEDSTYLFFAPITSLIWRKFVGYEPIVHLVFPQSTQLTDFVEIKLKELNIKTYDVNFLQNDYGTGVLASACRIYSCLIQDLDDSDYILISDIDMWPLDRDWFHLQDWNKPMHFWGADSYPYAVWNMLPSCYNGATKQWWKNFLNVMDCYSVENGIQKHIEHFTMCHNAKFGKFWGYEEMLLAHLLLQIPNHRSSFQFIDREPGQFFHPDRLHRDHWTSKLLEDSTDPCIAALRHTLKPFDGTIKGFKDAHLLRPGYTEENWPDLHKILTQLLSEEDLRWVEEYVKDFRSLLND